MDGRGCTKLAVVVDLTSVDQLFLFCESVIYAVCLRRLFVGGGCLRVQPCLRRIMPRRDANTATTTDGMYRNRYAATLKHDAHCTPQSSVSRPVTTDNGFKNIFMRRHLLGSTCHMSLCRHTGMPQGPHTPSPSPPIPVPPSSLLTSTAHSILQRIPSFDRFLTHTPSHPTSLPFKCCSPFHPFPPPLQTSPASAAVLVRNPPQLLCTLHPLVQQTIPPHPLP